MRLGRPLHLWAMLLSVASASGTPSEKVWPPLSVEVEGSDAQPHRLSVFMSAGGGAFGHEPCDSGVFALYEDGLVIFTRPRPDCRTMQAHVAPQAARALVEDLFTLGFASFPYEQSVSAATDLGGVSLMVRRGRRWHATGVYGLTRFGEVTCCNDEIPHPRLVGAVRRLTGFDVPTATEWEPQEFAISFNPASYYPPEYVAHAVPWPADLPRPVLDPAAPSSQTRVFEMRFFARASSLVAPDANSFVTIDGKSWAVHVFPVLPEHLHRKAVDVAVSRARWDLQQQGL